MLRTLTLFKAAPYVAALLLLAVSGAYIKGRSDGYAKSEQQHQADGMAAFVRAVHRVADIGEAIAEIGRQLREQIADSRENEIQSTRTVRAANVAHPDFAAMRRPAEHQRVRVDQLERIRRAAETD